MTLGVMNLPHQQWEASCSEDGSWTGSVIGEMYALFVEEVVKANQGQKKNTNPVHSEKIAIMQFRHVKN